MADNLGQGQRISPAVTRGYDSRVYAPELDVRVGQVQIQAPEVIHQSPEENIFAEFSAALLGGAAGAVTGLADLKKSEKAQKIGLVADSVEEYSQKYVADVLANKIPNKFLTSQDFKATLDEVGQDALSQFEKDNGVVADKDLREAMLKGFKANINNHLLSDRNRRLADYTKQSITNIENTIKYQIEIGDVNSIPESRDQLIDLYIKEGGDPDLAKRTVNQYIEQSVRQASIKRIVLDSQFDRANLISSGLTPEQKQKYAEDIAAAKSPLEKAAILDRYAGIASNSQKIEAITTERSVNNDKIQAESGHGWLSNQAKIGELQAKYNSLTLEEQQSPSGDALAQEINKRQDLNQTLESNYIANYQRNAAMNKIRSEVDADNFGDILTKATIKDLISMQNALVQSLRNTPKEEDKVPIRARLERVKDQIETIQYPIQQKIDTIKTLLLAGGNKDREIALQQGEALKVSILAFGPLGSTLADRLDSTMREGIREGRVTTDAVYQAGMKAINSGSSDDLVNLSNSLVGRNNQALFSGLSRIAEDIQGSAQFKIFTDAIDKISKTSKSNIFLNLAYNEQVPQNIRKAMTYAIFNSGDQTTINSVFNSPDVLNFQSNGTAVKASQRAVDYANERLASTFKTGTKGLNPIETTRLSSNFQEVIQDYLPMKAALIQRSSGLQGDDLRNVLSEETMRIVKEFGVPFTESHTLSTDVKYYMVYPTAENAWARNPRSRTQFGSELQSVTAALALGVIEKQTRNFDALAEFVADPTVYIPQGPKIAIGSDPNLLQIVRRGDTAGVIPEFAIPLDGNADKATNPAVKELIQAARSASKSTGFTWQYELGTAYNLYLTEHPDLANYTSRLTVGLASNFIPIPDVPGKTLLDILKERADSKGK